MGKSTRLLAVAGAIALALGVTAGAMATGRDKAGEGRPVVKVADTSSRDSAMNPADSSPDNQSPNSSNDSSGSQDQSGWQDSTSGSNDSVQSGSNDQGQHGQSGDQSAGQSGDQSGSTSDHEGIDRGDD